MNVYLSQNKRDKSGSTLVFSTFSGGIWTKRISLIDSNKYKQGEFYPLPDGSTIVREPDNDEAIADDDTIVDELSDDELEALTNPEGDDGES